MTTPEKPVPATSGASWRRVGERVLLVGRRCRSCGKRAFSVAPYCDHCLSEAFEAVDLGDRGVLYTFSEIHIAPPQFQTPYVVGYVDMGDDVRVFAQIEGKARDLAMGALLVATVGSIRNDDGNPVQGFKFRPEGGGHD